MRNSLAIFVFYFTFAGKLKLKNEFKASKEFLVINV